MLAAAFKLPTLISDPILLNRREGLKLWTTIYWIHEQDLAQPQKDQLERVSRKMWVLRITRSRLLKAVAGARERIQMYLRLYEQEPGNAEANKLRSRKEEWIGRQGG